MDPNIKPLVNLDQWYFCDHCDGNVTLTGIITEGIGPHRKYSYGNRIHVSYQQIEKIFFNKNNVILCIETKHTKWNLLNPYYIQGLEQNTQQKILQQIIRSFDQ